MSCCVKDVKLCCFVCSFFSAFGILIWYCIFLNCAVFKVFSDLDNNEMSVSVPVQTLAPPPVPAQADSESQEGDSDERNEGDSEELELWPYDEGDEWDSEEEASSEPWPCKTRRNSDSAMAPNPRPSPASTPPTELRKWKIRPWKDKRTRALLVFPHWGVFSQKQEKQDD